MRRYDSGDHRRSDESDRGEYDVQVCFERDDLRPGRHVIRLQRRPGQPGAIAAGPGDCYLSLQAYSHGNQFCAQLHADGANYGARPMKMNRKHFVRPVRNGERGQSLVLMAGLLIGLLSMAALVIDLGNVYFSYRQLQAATDAAALAGAEDLPNTTATATATTYSSANVGNKNYNSNQSVMTNITETATLQCLTTTLVPCLPPANMNAIVVTETAKVHTTFAKLFGVSTVNITATATGSAKNGNYGPFNVMMVVDNTPSMSLVDSGCTLPSPNNT